PSGRTGRSGWTARGRRRRATLELPSFSRRGGFAALAARQVSWLPGMQRAEARCAPSPPSPALHGVEWLRWDWLPGYSGGPGAAFGPPPSKALSGGAAGGQTVRGLLLPLRAQVEATPVPFRAPPLVLEPAAPGRAGGGAWARRV